jgi:hypothetical protein
MQIARLSSSAAAATPKKSIQKKRKTQTERKQGHLETVSHTQQEEEINKNANRNVSKKNCKGTQTPPPRETTTADGSC